MTHAGDGIVAHSESYLPDAHIDILPADPASLMEDPEQYCHLHLPRNPEVIDQVMAYLCDPSMQPLTGVSMSLNISSRIKER